MGSASSKVDKNDAVKLCKLRASFIGRAIDSRNHLAAAHVSYITSLKNLGSALRRFAEADVASVGEAEHEKTPTPSQTSYLSPSPSHLTESPFAGGSPVAGARVVGLSYNEGGKNEVTVELDSNNGSFASFVVEDEHKGCGDPRGSWDFFDAEDDGVSFTFEGAEGTDGWDDMPADPTAVKGFPAVREDSSEFITHRAKDFVSSIRDIEHRFFRASEAGKEIARMLESGNLRFVHTHATDGDSTALKILSAVRTGCCGGTAPLVSNGFSDPSDTSKVIEWKRTASMKSSSSRTQFSFSPEKETASDSGSDFADELFMIAGSHSSTLERLYAWERKLHDEVKASDSIRREYEHKCAQLKKQSSEDLKLRVSVKDLHSRIRVAIHSVDMIAKKIERIRDDEVHHQLLELLHGLVRMWKTMVECHHAQYITISLAYHARNSTGGQDGNLNSLRDLLREVEGFGSSFAMWVNAHAAYVECVEGWLRNCVVLASNESGPFSPGRVIAPPIFVLCRDWLAGIKSLPLGELCDSIKGFLSDVKEEKNLGQKRDLHGVSTCLTRVLDRLHKFSEASLKTYEDVLKKSEVARSAYSSVKPY